MYIIVSTDSRLPEDIEKGFQVEQWTPSEFFTKASNDDGLEIDEGIWYDVSDLTSEIYDGLNAYIDAGVNIIYYRFDDRPIPSFTITQDVKVYSAHKNDSPVTKSEPEPELVVSQESSYVQQVQLQQQMEQIQPVEQPVEQQVQTTPQLDDTQHMPVQNVTQEPIQTSIQQPEININPTMQFNLTQQQMQQQMNNLLQFDDYDAGDRSKSRKAAPAKVILFGSSKGGTGKTFTCLISAYWYAKNHPTERIALADFDIIDGQIGITINKLTPTMNDYYKLYKGDRKDFSYLENVKVKSDHFSPNIDFYLAPSQDIPIVTNDNEFWMDIFNKLISNYDVVFFDSGIDYIGKLPISNLYKIADKIIITSNPSINSVKSVIKQFKTLSGIRANNTFRVGDNILSKVKVVLTRIDSSDDIINIVRQNITKYVPIVAEFGQIDKEIQQVQWYQQWITIDSSPKITEQLDKIIEF